MSDIRTFQQIEPHDVQLVGGKGLSLGLLVRAGLPVPEGFCVTTTACQRSGGRPPAEDAPLAAAITEAYCQLGEGPVAVRSSATAEDSAAASFAGQQETLLGVTGAANVLAAIAHCWASLHTERALAYRRHQRVEEQGLAMAVVVQRLVPAEVAGVLFTRDPLDPEGRRMLIEAAWGLGEGVVSGRVSPDRYHVDRVSGMAGESHLGTKGLMVRSLHAGRTEYVIVPPDQQQAACLNEDQLAQLAELGRRVEAFFGEPRDVEWAYAEGRFWLLQARPITTATAAEREEVRRAEIVALAARVEPDGTIWSRFNLAEILPTPTPMTWAIVRRFMSGQGGFGLMYRDLGFDPDPALAEEGIFDLICGRPYCNLDRQLRLQFRQPPLEYPFAALKAAPEKAVYPQPVANPARAGARFWLLLPYVTLRLSFRIAKLHRTLPQRLRQSVYPTFDAETEREARVDLARLDAVALLEKLEDWTRRTLIDFARESLKPTALAGMVLEGLERKLASLVGPERVPETLGQLMQGCSPDPEADLPAAVRALAEGQLEPTEFLRRFGHRGSQEMELSQPRWAETGFSSQPTSPERERRANDNARHSRSGLVTGGALSEEQGTRVQGDVDRLRTYLALRETGKHYLMKGYALLRRILVELDRRFRLQGGVFFLTPDELPRLVAGDDLTALIAKRKRQRLVALSLEMPQVLFSDDLEAIGRPVAVAGAVAWQGVALSAGTAEGPALVLEEPLTDLAPSEPFILVCPSTDPAWVPLFVRACGLVMETGGVLSHGAIVAREFGLPAVAGLAAVTRRIRTGQRLRVEGTTGRVVVLG